MPARCVGDPGRVPDQLFGQYALVRDAAWGANRGVRRDLECDPCPDVDALLDGNADSARDRHPGSDPDPDAHPES